MKRIFALILLITVTSCAELQGVVSQLPQGGTVSELDIANGLRQALDLGIDKQVSKLTQTDGFFKNELVKILLPEELQKELSSNNELKNYFNDFTLSKQREFCEYISSAKRDVTKQSRLEKVISLILNKKGLYDKYKNC